MAFENRRTYLFRHVDPARTTGLEIGPYYNPTVHKHEGDVRYLDFFSQAELAAREVDRRDPDAVIPVVDYVVKSDDYWRHVDRSFDYVIANHVIEHTDNPVQWLIDLFRMVEDDGVVFLTIPDKKYNFDRYRSDTPLSHLVTDYFRGCGDPREHGVELELFYDTAYVGTPIDIAKKLDEGRLRNAYAAEPHPGRHNHVFQSETFERGVLRPLQYMGVWPYTLLEFGPAPENHGEFYVVLKKRPEAVELTPEQMYRPWKSTGPPETVLGESLEERRAELELVKRELALTSEKLEEAQAELASLRGSRVWRATRPLRALLRKGLRI